MTGGRVNFAGRHMLQAINLSKSYGGVRAVDSVSFTLERGSITGLIGPNGAGKSTLFNLITGAERASGGNSYWTVIRSLIGAEYRQAVAFLIMLAVLPLRPRGLLGEEAMVLRHIKD